MKTNNTERLENIVNNIEKLRKVFDNNQKLQSKVLEGYEENEMFWIRGILKEVEKGLSDWSIGFNNYNYINLYSRLYFLDGCESIQRKFGIFKEETEQLINKVLNKIDTLDCMSYNNKQYDNLELWIGQKTEEIKESLLDYFNGATDVKDEWLFDYFIDCYLDNINIEDFYYNKDSYELFEHIEYNKSYV